VTQKKRQRLLFGSLAAVLLLAVWQYLPGGGDDLATSPAPQLGGGGAFDEGGGGAPPQQRPVRDSGPPVREVVDLRVGALEAPVRISTPGRDPWRFVDPPPPPEPPPPPPPSREELERQRLAAEAAARARAEAEERARQLALIPKPPPFTLTYLGYFGPESRKIATFKDGKAVINVKEGDVLQGKFIVAKIGYESVDIKFVGFENLPPQRVAIGR
jgi:hypothetical protein